MRQTFAGRRQAIHGEVQTLDIVGLYPPLSYPDEVHVGIVSSQQFCMNYTYVCTVWQEINYW